MKLLLIIFFLFNLNFVSGQQNIETFALKLTSSCKTDREKVASIVRWITDNISYCTSRNKIPVIGFASQKFASDDEEEDGSPLKPLNERVAEKVLRTRTAICDGYARLFKVLCDYNEIQSEIIDGYARSGYNKPGSKFSVNHSWNAVYFDTIWHLLDIAWASGYISSNGNSFVREYDGRYILADPAKFILDHYPDDARWTLLPDKTVPSEFRFTPFKHRSFSKYMISSFQPAKGIIEAAVGDTIKIQLETANANKDKEISSSTMIDSALYTYSNSWIFLQPSSEMKPTSKAQKINYTYKVESADVEWLYLMYNKDIVLRYKLNIRKKKV